MDVSLLSAFLGGALALLSPCGALLLPGFFASTVSSRAALLPHALVFYLGLGVILVPIGIGAGALGALVIEHRTALIGVTSLVLIVLGVLHALGWGLDLGRLLPGFDRLQQSSTRGSGMVRTFLLGAVGGIAGFCAGPILGAVLTLAMGQGSATLAGILLAVYGAGMVIPLMLLAAVWGRVGERGRAVLRGREFTMFGRRLHTTTFATGRVTSALGVRFWATNGLVTLPSLVSTSTLARWQANGAVLDDPRVQVGVILTLAVVGLLLWWRQDRRRRREDAAPTTITLTPGKRP